MRLIAIAWVGFLCLVVVSEGFAQDHDEMSGRAPDGRVAVRIDASQQRLAGIAVTAVRVGSVAPIARAPAVVVPDESRVRVVVPRVAGWVQELLVSTTGERVQAGQPVARIFSQELLASQTEFLAALIAAERNPTSAVVAAARVRLAVLGMAEADIRSIETSGRPLETVTVVAPGSGYVARRSVAAGAAVGPTTEIMTIVDLRRVWVLAEFSEHVAATLGQGDEAVLSFPAAGLPSVKAPVAFIYPTLAPTTRTLRVRFELPNGDELLRPGTYGSAELPGGTREALTVPRNALVDTGVSQHVFVLEDTGEFVPRLVQTGTRGTEWVEIISGLSIGDRVAESGVFLLDSESRLRAAGGSAEHAAMGMGSPEDSRDDATDHGAMKMD